MFIGELRACITTKEKRREKKSIRLCKDRKNNLILCESYNRKFEGFGSCAVACSLKELERN